MNRKISVAISDVSNKNWPFEGLKELIDFLKAEAKYWEEKRAAISPQNNTSNVHKHLDAHGILSNAVSTIEGWENILDSWDENQLNQQLNNLFQSISLQSSWLWSGHPFSNQFIKCYEIFGENAATAFLDLILRKQASNITNGESFLGSVLAYEFLNQDSNLTKRHISEQASLEHLRSTLDETTTQLIGKVESFTDNFSNWDTEIKNGWQDWLINTAKDFKTSQDTNKEGFNKYMKDCETRVSDLENTYQEKLRLEKPATYWKKAAKKYGFQGGLWFLALVSFVLLGILYFRDLYVSWLGGHEIAMNVNTIQGVVIFGSILAIYAFLVRTLSRLIFSSFHLMRDAEERELLTYLYLSLSKDREIGEASRDIVLQALFSRSETGLLASESGPTMPGIGELFKHSQK
ncbi:hypothetical protein MGMO_86c00010 [Methyloglobulus morosus KoM1]|uniref:DUF6161 domain-containing protein n=1 Tax=Methyloglobulus morosus KoM1 TaxID=1116472 RepID=V5DWY9_9GAMM|nr:DUF6161 domain-containing protein [Methyloglobulus morosus]ESS71841.1 hypothetical protein MGMO_86c00010 [Methyloglobulus morosus KoM1]